MFIIAAVFRNLAERYFGWLCVRARVIFRSFSTYTLENDSGSDEVLISGGDELQLPQEEEDQHVCVCLR